MAAGPGGVCAAVGWACATRKAATIRAPAVESNPSRLLIFISVTPQIVLGTASVPVEAKPIGIHFDQRSTYAAQSSLSSLSDTESSGTSDEINRALDGSSSVKE
jgi:hypothetical protein